MRVLVIEDEKRMANFIQRGLKEEGYAVDIAPDGERGWEYASVNEYDIIVLDWMLPKMDGITLCSRLRQSGSSSSILMLTVRDALEDKIKGLDAGADDYLTKPFSFEELLARLRALSRRPRHVQQPTVLKAGHLSVDLVSH